MTGEEKRKELVRNLLCFKTAKGLPYLKPSYCWLRGPVSEGPAAFPASKEIGQRAAPPAPGEAERVGCTSTSWSKGPQLGSAQLGGFGWKM